MSVRQLIARRQRLGSEVADPEGTLRGVVLRQGRRCSSAGCRCRRGELHGPYTYLATYGERRSRTIYVPAATADVVEARVALTQRDEELLAEISLINVELLRRRALG